MNGWWIGQFITENRDGQNARTGQCDLRKCPICKKVWSRVGGLKERYYLRKDVPFYGHPEKKCKVCK